MPFAQMSKVWIGRWNLEYDLLGCETWTYHLLIRLFYTHKLLAGDSWKREY